MRKIIITIAALALSGCVTYVHKFDPKQQSVVCGNAAGCRPLVN